MRAFFLACISIFTAQIRAQISTIVSLPKLPEVSGLIRIHEQYWGLTDGGNPLRLYQIDTATGDLIDSTTFANISNIDWEELTHNDSYVFIGDFGNNNGNRKDLCIYKFPISELGKKNVNADTISFYYPSQTSFTNDPFTIYDCEAMTATNDSIFLFSKSLKDALCRVYTLPIHAGNYPAQIRDTIPLTFWVTGAAVEQNNLVLCGYGFNGNLVPAIYETQINASGIGASGKSTTLALNLSNQLESIVHLAPLYYLLATENSNGHPAQLYRYSIPSNALSNNNKAAFSAYQDPGTKKLIILLEPNASIDQMYLMDASGKIIRAIPRSQGREQILQTGHLPSGVYFLLFQSPQTVYSKKIYLE